MNTAKDSFFKYIIFTSRASMIFILSITLISIGLLIFSFFSIQKGIKILQEDIPAKIIFKSEYSNSDKVLLNNFLTDSIKGKQVKSSVFVSKEDGLKEMSEILGDDLKGVFSQKSLIQNPLPDIKNIYLLATYHSPEFFNHLEKEIEKFECVEYFQPPINIMKLNIYKSNILMFSSIVSLIFFIISVLLIYNNIRLSIYNNRVNIKAMQLVGATKSFIRAPFIKKSIWIGLQSGIISISFLALAFYICCLYFPKLEVLLTSLEIIQFCLLIIFLGVLISFISTFIVLKKLTSLKTDINE
tara:strand:- start:1746 stop:2642 length:897 start_codon:yes stop_codon:yes gene_type:complete